MHCNMNNNMRINQQNMNMRGNNQQNMNMRGNQQYCGEEEYNTNYQGHQGVREHGYQGEGQCWDQDMQMGNMGEMNMDMDMGHGGGCKVDLCVRCGKWGHEMGVCKEKINVGGRVIKQNLCTQCGFFGHTFRQCKTVRYTCECCGRIGHRTHECKATIAVTGVEIALLHSFCGYCKIFGPHDCNGRVGESCGSKRMRPDECNAGRQMPIRQFQPRMGGPMDRPVGMRMTNLDLGSPIIFDQQRCNFDGGDGRNMNMSNTWKNRSSGSTSWGGGVSKPVASFKTVEKKVDVEEVEEKEVGEICEKDSKKDESDSDSSSSDSDSDSDSSDSDSDSSDDEDEVVVEDKNVGERVEEDQFDFEDDEDIYEGC